MIICLGPVCVPLHLLLPFLVALAHQHGYLTWFRREWVMWRWWKARLFGGGEGEPAEAAAPAAQPAQCCKAEADAPAANGSAATAAEEEEPQQAAVPEASVAAGGASGSVTRRKRGPA
ncbi:outer membrane lipo -sorting [Chlorella sorokiniana]|uniref:Outer membrane lipo-sorting n=1 Tax=Chlorella sorokiniana TaxID=3076 RepID=A0A2P6U3A4_CHLSO|nr:outer membrane lipo -sorting [Chlorella sorokiniana]|eukprot:PRW60800.1 outer membrane lipo -sorting [Chlorella sorokiniana]